MRVFQRIFAACAAPDWLRPARFRFRRRPSAASPARSASRSIPNQFQIVQDFGAPSPRYQGRYHTGEDWYGGRDSYGTHVRAIANGQVTFSSPNGWGRDGGVIIIAPRLPRRLDRLQHVRARHRRDRRHLSRAVHLRPRQGDVIAAVGDPRPAPHLHFEIRTNQAGHPRTRLHLGRPGARRLAASEQVRRQLAGVVSRAARAGTPTSPTKTGPVAPPVELSDHSLLALDANRVLRISSDGRVLWRVILESARRRLDRCDEQHADRFR